MKEEIKGLAGFLVAGLGAAATVLAWAPRARVNIDGGFAGSHRDLSVLYIDLPLITAGGALVPFVFWVLTLRRFRRPWLAAVVAAGVAALGIWGLTSWWVPYQAPEFGYEGAFHQFRSTAPVG
ncbi:hypothetical protein L1I79_11500 [Strepomyces sp. STD 3.1]|uniref:hypothetical protein n=1 Tax=Streptomyces sp. NPDC058985 TaxID=3346684 RepID=UPI001F19DB82|nr:hypothetical protein [Streptomyces sp. STD 3.1]